MVDPSARPALGALWPLLSNVTIIWFCVATCTCLMNQYHASKPSSNAAAHLYLGGRTMLPSLISKRPSGNTFWTSASRRISTACCCSCSGPSVSRPSL